jgi:hypothetical protein
MPFIIDKTVILQHFILLKHFDLSFYCDSWCFNYIVIFMEVSYNCNILINMKYTIRKGRLLLNSLVQFFKWLFKRGSNNINRLISFIIVFIAIQFFDYNLVRKNPLLLIPLLFTLLVLFQLIDSLLCRNSGTKIRRLDSVTFVLTIMIITRVSVAFN